MLQVTILRSCQVEFGTREDQHSLLFANDAGTFCLESPVRRIAKDNLLLFALLVFFFGQLSTGGLMALNSCQVHGVEVCSPPFQNKDLLLKAVDGLIPVQSPSHGILLQLIKKTSTAPNIAFVKPLNTRCCDEQDFASARKAYPADAHGKAVMIGAGKSTAIYKKIRHPEEDAGNTFPSRNASFVTPWHHMCWECSFFAQSAT